MYADCSFLHSLKYIVLSTRPAKMWILIGCLIFALRVTFTNGMWCPADCTCMKKSMTCTSTSFPRQLPKNITAVFIRGFNYDNFHQGLFSSSDWKRLKTLDIQGGIGSVLGNHTFVGLANLEHLGVHSDSITYVDECAFGGLDKVRSLDLSNNYLLSPEEIQKSLDARKCAGLKSIRFLSLDNLRSHRVLSIDIDYAFLEALSMYRSLTYLDLSGLNLNILDIGACQDLLCESIEHIKLQRLTLVRPSNWTKAKPCNSLRTLDLTGTVIPLPQETLPFVTSFFDCKKLYVYNHIQNLDLSGMLSIPKDIQSFTLNMTDCLFNFRKIVIRKNHLRRMNFTVIMSKSLEESLFDLDLSDNLIDYIDPKTLNPSQNLQKLNMSSNQLFKMQHLYSIQFSVLFFKLKGLRELYLTKNGLTNLPENVFIANTKLEYIDVSRNRLNALTFGIEHLIRLRFLDLSYNEIKIIQPSMCNQLDILNDIARISNKTDGTRTGGPQISQDDYGNETLHENQDGTLVSYSFKVNLEFNTIACRCAEEQVQFLRWLRSSNAIYKTTPTSAYTCEFERDTLDILNTAVSKMEDFCALQTRLHILKISAISIVAVLAVATVLALCVTYRLRQKKRYETLLKQLKSDTYHKQFMVFLSYSSEDTDFVLTKIYPDLHETLSDLTENNRNYICIGDRNFQPGRHVTAEVARCMEDSTVVIFVVSNTFCRKGWCQSEVNEAYAQRKPIIMLMKERVDKGLMPRFLNTIFSRYTHASWVGNEEDGHMEPDIRTLCESVLKLAIPEKENLFNKCPLFKRRKTPYIANEEVELEIM